MNQQITIRQAVVADLDAIEAIEQACFGAAGDAFSRRVLRGLICRVQGAFLVAVCDGVLVGYISLLARRTARNLRIYSIAVDCLSRGCGAGQALVDAAVEEAKKRGLVQVTLEVRADNIAAISLYRKNGFITSRRLKAYYHDGSDGWQMKKHLI